MPINNLVISPATGEDGNSFVGIQMKGGKIEFHYPESYRLGGEDEAKKDILKILKTIRLAKKLGPQNNEILDAYVNIDEEPLDAYLWIINDYMTYKRYENKEPTNAPGIVGKINWHKTLQDTPYIDKHQNIYPKFTSVVMVQKDNLLSEIYLYCVKKSIEALGWLYNINDNIEIGMASGRKPKYLMAINDALSKTFDDNKKKRLTNMKLIIAGLDTNLKHRKSSNFGVKSYEYVFETMVDTIFGTEDVTQYYPNGHWQLIGSAKNHPSSNLRPDTIFEYQNRLYIIDSKYYRYGTTRNNANLPETTSLGKQYIYDRNARLKGKTYDSILSAFILPYKKSIQSFERYKELQNTTFEYIGQMYSSWSTEYKVHAVLVDLKDLIDEFLKFEDTFEYREALAEEIDVNDIPV